MTMEYNDLIKKNAAKLNLAADYYKLLNPVLSRHYLLESSNLIRNCGLPSVSWSQCLHCGSAYVAGNYSVRLYPRLKLSRRIRRRMKNKTKAENSSLSQHLLELTRKRENRIVISCQVCKMRSTFRSSCIKDKPLTQSKFPIKKNLQSTPVTSTKSSHRPSGHKHVNSSSFVNNKQITRKKENATTTYNCKNMSFLTTCQTPVSSSMSREMNASKTSNKKTRNKESNRILSNVLSREKTANANSPSLMDFLSSI